MYSKGVCCMQDLFGGAPSNPTGCTKAENNLPIIVPQAIILSSNLHSTESISCKVAPQIKYFDEKLRNRQKFRRRMVPLAKILKTVVPMAKMFIPNGGADEMAIYCRQKVHR